MKNVLIAVAVLAACAGCHRTSTPTSAPMTGAIMASPLADHCATAPLIAAPVTITGDLTGAVSDSNEPIAITNYAWLGRDHFFAIDLQAGQPLTLSLIEQGWDGGVYIFRNCAAIAATTVAGLDTSRTRPLTFTAPAAGRYIIAVDAWQPNTGAAYTFSVVPGIVAPLPMIPTSLPTLPNLPIAVPTPTIAAAPPVMPAMPAGPMIPAMPVADQCATAQPVNVPSNITGDLTNATADSNDRIAVTGYSWAGRDHFFALLLTQGQHVRLTLDDGGRFDGGLYVFQNCANIAGTTIAGRDTNPTAPLEFVAPAAGRYIVAVDAWRANTGAAYTLAISP